VPIIYRLIGTGVNSRLKIFSSRAKYKAKIIKDINYKEHDIEVKLEIL
jgi:hypothetical protein